MRYPTALWSGRRPLLQALLSPLSLIFAALATLRRWAYRRGLLAQWMAPVPVIIVGNISVGGTGKTPVTCALVDALRTAGWRPGVISRGFGGRGGAPRRVAADDRPEEVGDEPLLLAGHAPVVVCPDRPAAARHLLETTDCDVIVSDDGLQHYALGRTIEWVVLDGRRLLGNGWLLPAGPLREPPSRLASVDAVLVNGGVYGGAHRIDLIPGDLVQVADPDCHRPLDWLTGRRVHAVAGIGNPARFFATLRELGANPIEHPFADHHRFTVADLAFDDDLPVVMTAKDAVKCRCWARQDWWLLPVATALPAGLTSALLERLAASRHDNPLDQGA